MIQIDGKNLPIDPLVQEWLETDGRGGYATSTLSGCHTRRYHGLWVANLPTPEGRHVLLSKLEDSLLTDGGVELFLTVHRYPGVLFPPGPTPPTAFTQGLHPTFLYQRDRLRLKKELLLLRDPGLLLIRYRLEESGSAGRLRLKPFLAFRGYHTLARENQFINPRAEEIARGFRIEPYPGMPPLLLTTSSASHFLPSPCWYKDFEYEQERERGFDWHEDLFLPGTIETALAPGGAVILAVGCTLPRAPLPEIWEAEIARRRKAAQTPKPAGLRAGRERNLFRELVRSGRQFLIITPSGKPAIIAGYPWFGSWGRDALIALPGLCLACGRIPEGIEILCEISRHEREGLLPNFFSGDGKPEAYNTVDSSLFFFWTLQELLRVTGDAALIRDRFWPVMTRIVECFRRGTGYGIGMEGNGLLKAGEEGLALTWMDALVDGVPVTPRQGCAVEINALWYNALCFTRELAARFGEATADLDDLLPRLRAAFRETFWIPEGAYLGDVFHRGNLDRAIRPNQIFAVSLPFSPLTAEQQVGVVRTVREHLLTPCGLRTLSPADPAYRGLYRGNSAQRDAAYHQGTVWPWLLGPFGEAALRVTADRAGEREALRESLGTFLRRHLVEAGIGTVSEVFDGDSPHAPGGCIAQAWSVAELIRLYRLLLTA